MLMQAGVEIPYKPIAKSYQSVFGDRISDNFKRFIEKLLPAAEEFESSSSSSSSSSKDHAATVLSFSESSPEQVWIFDQLSLISFFIDITIHFICLRTASSRRQRNSNHHHHASSSAAAAAAAKDHAAAVLSLSESYDKQVWIFDQLSLISCFIGITIHFISLRTASAR